MFTPKKIVGIVCVAAVALAGVFLGASNPVSGAAVQKPGIFINITSGQEDLHAVSMALGLAKTSLEHGNKVVVFLNVHAPLFASKSLGAEVKFADFPPVRDMLAEAVSKGATVMVCGHCASVCSVMPGDLIAGVTVSEHGGVLERLEPGMVGFSY